MSIGFLVGCISGALFGTTLGLFIGGLCATAGNADDEIHLVSQWRARDEGIPPFLSSLAQREQIPEEPLSWKSVGPPPHSPLKGHAQSYHPLEN